MKRSLRKRRSRSTRAPTATRCGCGTTTSRPSRTRSSAGSPGVGSSRDQEGGDRYEIARLKPSRYGRNRSAPALRDRSPACPERSRGERLVLHLSLGSSLPPPIKAEIERGHAPCADPQQIRECAGFPAGGCDESSAD